LNEAKELTRHGEWLGWLEHNFSQSRFTAASYMRVVGEYPSNVQALTHLIYEDALKELATPREAPEDTQPVNGQSDFTVS
jgi:hypothetical protein